MCAMSRGGNTFLRSWEPPVGEVHLHCSPFSIPLTPARRGTTHWIPEKGCGVGGQRGPVWSERHLPVVWPGGAVQPGEPEPFSSEHGGALPVLCLRTWVSQEKTKYLSEVCFVAGRDHDQGLWRKK